MKTDSVAAPASRSELETRAGALVGRTLGSVADELGWRAPHDLRVDKGFVGHLMERALGATAHSRAEPDFPDLGIELKTIPLAHDGRPRESTWVCGFPTRPERDWARSGVRRKLATVLWVGVTAAGPVPERTVVSTRLWSPSADEEAVLRADWETLTELALEGAPGSLHGGVGTALQVRPKAADAGALAWTLDGDGEWVRQQPRGFYLRRSFTAAILVTSRASPP